ncbi:hypothetical protein A1O1_01843 [Capronia coronata CBS 617.96]|uniref:Uncharacterized protein n=1 Tax=Capronia coronata CBS 617.96 TaxID=1182541 RepID=W9YW09_9EURO|nr:uncharacterized protein A1O1_01843 [Capronia coronata CBS 617.96]EXJ93451.1 hypothetical protein A1O1_01843 [Capronia coronata CBS 617.96]
MEFFQYDCPRTRYHTHADVLLSYGHFILVGDKKCVRMRQEVVDLILRAYEHGPGHGLPASFLTMSGQDRHGVSQTHEARLVNG